MTTILRTLVLSAAIHLTATAALAAPPQATAQQMAQSCFQELAHGRGRELACTYPAWLTEQERSDLRKLTREMLQDARCTVTVRIERLAIDNALDLPDHVFQAPPQPVSCEITLKDSTMSITATFAPRVVIKGGVAVEATPGLADVQGINGYLAWPVVQYVNHAPGIRRDMLAMINAYMQRTRTRADARR